MTFHHRSRLPSVINYSDYFNLSGRNGCCCSLQTNGSISPVSKTFAECQQLNGYFILAAGDNCSSVECPVGGRTGCCCACSYLTKEQRALVDLDMIGSTYGMVDNVGECLCEDLGGKWIEGPCNRSNPSLHCRTANGVDVRLPKACCGATLVSYTISGVSQVLPTPFCEDVCTPKECADNVLTTIESGLVVNYNSTFYTNGRRCFYESKNLGAPVASGECVLKRGLGSGLASSSTNVNYNLPVCNNSNFYCWGNGCERYVNLIDDGFYTNPTVNDYGSIQNSGAASVLYDFNDIDENKNVVGDGLFVPFTDNYLYMRSRYGKAAFITLDNKVIVSNGESIGFARGIKYGNNYARVEIGKNFVILLRQFGIITNAEFKGYLTPGVTPSASELNKNGVQSVHALEEAVCITRINPLLNVTELICQGYPFNRTQLQVVDGGMNSGFKYNVVPETVSCNGFHCTYLLQKLNDVGVLLEQNWVTSGEYKRTRTTEGIPIPPVQGRIFKPLPDSTQFLDGMVVAGQNFDCFLEPVIQDPSTGDGFTKLSCFGIWDPSDTNSTISTITDYAFGTIPEIPGLGGQFADCDYNKCFAVSPVLNYCEGNATGICCKINPYSCESGKTRSQCERENGSFYTAADNFTCTDCILFAGITCGSGLEERSDENGIYARWLDIDLSSANVKTDNDNKKYIDVDLIFNTYFQKDRVIVLAKKSTDSTSNAILNSAISVNAYGNNGGPASSGYTGYAPFNTQESGQGDHPYFSYNNDDFTPCPTDGIIYDSGCVSTLNQLTIPLTINEDQMNFEIPGDPNYKKIRLVVFGGCESNISTRMETEWYARIDCP